MNSDLSSTSLSQPIHLRDEPRAMPLRCTVRRIPSALWRAIAVCLSLVCPSIARGQNIAACPRLNTDTSSASAIVVLGVGTPNLTAERSGTGLGIAIRGTLYLFDAGPGVERRLFELCARPSVKFERYGPVFISHLHSDHTLGLPALLYHAHNPNEPFHVIGPPGIRNMMTHIVAAYAEDRAIRVHGGQQMDSTRWETDVREVTSGIVYQDPNITVTAFEVPHGKWAHALGYRVQTPDRTIVISGDTRPAEAIVKACDGCDVLLHELYFRGDDYGREYHTSPEQLADIASRAKPKMLIIYHARPTPAQQIAALRTISTRFAGPVVFARDLDVY